MRVYIYVIISAILGLEPYAPVEKSLEERLMSEVAGLEAAFIRIESSRFMFLVFGLCRRVTVELRGLRIGGIRIDLFRIESRKFRFSPFSTFVLGKAVVRGGGNTSWSLKIIEEDLEDFLDSKGPILKGTEVRIAPDCITICRPSTIASMLKLREPLTLAGRLVLSEKKKVMLELQHLQTFGIAPGQPILRTILSIANPVLTASDINRLLDRINADPLKPVKIRAAFEDITTGENHVIVSGKLKLARAENNGEKEQKQVKEPRRPRRKKPE